MNATENDVEFGVHHRSRDGGRWILVAVAASESAAWDAAFSMMGQELTGDWRVDRVPRPRIKSLFDPTER